MVGGSTYLEGRVEINRWGSWGTICDDNWDINDANVVCKMLGYGKALNGLHSAHFGQGTGSIMMDNVQCTGREEGIHECKHQGYYNHDCSHSEDAGVICEGPIKIL